MANGSPIDDRFTQAAEQAHRLRRWLVAATIGLFVAVVVMGIKGVMSPDVSVLPISFSAALLTVTLIANATDMLPLFSLGLAGFAVVSVPSLGEAAEWTDRKFLLARQEGEPHRGDWIFPGGLCASAETQYDTAKRKVASATDEDIRLSATAYRSYRKRGLFAIGRTREQLRLLKRLHKQHGLKRKVRYAYRGNLYEGFWPDKPLAEREGVTKWMTGDEILRDNRVPPLVQSYILEFELTLPRPQSDT